MTIDLAPAWRRGVATLGLLLLAACHGEGPCTGDDDGTGNLAVARVDNGAQKSESDDGNHIAYSQTRSCSERPTEVWVFEDVPVDTDIDGELLMPLDRPVATGTTVGEAPATFDVTPGTYIVCWVLDEYEPPHTPCTRVEVGGERVVITLNLGSTNRYVQH